MAFVRVTDPELADELYRVGLLYEEYYTETGPDTIEPAYMWGSGGVSSAVRGDCWKFYIYTEE